jgi:hypothetical protein
LDGGWASPILLKPLPHRNDLPRLLVDMHLVGSGAHVGIQDSEFSAVILGQWPGSTLHLVGDWGAHPLAQRAADALLAPYSGRFQFQERPEVRLMLPLQCWLSCHHPIASFPVVLVTDP